MKISDLIERLKGVLEKEGDLLVYISESEYGKIPEIDLGIYEPEENELDYSDCPITEKHLVLE